MSPPKDSERGAGTTRNGRGRTGDDEPGILSQLPRTRPQRSSRHRAAARNGSAADAPRPATASAANGHAPAAAKPGARASKKAVPATRSKARPSAKSGAAKSAGAGARSARKAPARGSAASGRADSGAAASTAMPTAPRQGFECEGERASGTVHPPGGAELVASAAEIVGEIAKAGLSTGERLLKDVLSRLPL
ncbi:MAG TPA: hypothetical protein VK721_02835 [Solirubrobacteraceae bacterium]|jgi:hypothetical protein|nr:hypothetical protein [Solirubrobacteraceae bacterium]